MDISTLQLLVLMVSAVAAFVGITIAMTSKSRPLKGGAYALTAALIAAVAVAVFLSPAKDADAAQTRNVVALLLAAAAGWAGLTAARAFRRK